jgi:predicted double-glycine peptidase
MAKAPRTPPETVKLSITVDMPTWRALRHAAEQERQQGTGRASVNALVNRLIVNYLKKGA